MSEERPACVVCRRREEVPVCGGCAARLREQLAFLTEGVNRLTYALVPGPGGGEKVSTSKEAPLPLRLSALTLLAGGSRWPMRAYADDQTGTLPPKVWIRAWAMDWRLEFGHSAEEVQVRAEAPVRDDGPPVDPRALLGIEGRQEPAQRAADPLSIEWNARWLPTPAPAVTRDHRYLLTWLDHACEHHPYIDQFALGLRSLVGAVKAALGDTDDLEYVGRCPEELTNRKTGERYVCGARIWVDPYVDQIACPRCRMTTDQSRRIWLARRILDTWPIDRRRRYPRGLIEILTLPLCGRCGASVRVEWIDATERSDTERFWRPGRVECPAGCGEVDI